MPTPRRLWDSCVVLGYLAGQESLREECDLIIDQAWRGDIEIAVSTLAQVEVAYLKGTSVVESEQRIREFFGRKYIIPIAFDIPVAIAARRFVRDYGLKPPDAVHLATASQWGIPVLETIDADLLRMDGLAGNPAVVVRRPLYDGPKRMRGVG